MGAVEADFAEEAVKEVAVEVHVVEVATELEKMEAVEAPAASPPEELVAPMAAAKMAEEEKAMESMEREREREAARERDTPCIRDSLCTCNESSYHRGYLGTRGGMPHT